MTRQNIQNSAVRDPRPQAFSQGVRANGLIFISGAVGSTVDDEAPRSFSDQARRAFGVIETLLAECGSTLADVVSTTIYVTDIDRKFDLVAVRREVFGDLTELPTSTLVEVSRLAPPFTDIEIQAIAIDHGVVGEN